MTIGVCESCHGAWVPGSATRALLEGRAALPGVAALDPGARYVTPPRPEDSPRLAHAEARAAGRSPVLRIVCADCRARLRMTDVPGVASCTRCGALWVPTGEATAIDEWYHHALRIRAAMSLTPTRIRYGQWRDIDEHGDFGRMLITLVAALAFFVVMAPLRGGFGPLAARLRALLLGAGGVGLVMFGCQFPSREQPGALTRRGFAWALSGVVLAVLAILDWS